MSTVKISFDSFLFLNYIAAELTFVKKMCIIRKKVKLLKKSIMQMDHLCL